MAQNVKQKEILFASKAINPSKRHCKLMAKNLVKQYPILLELTGLYDDSTAEALKKEGSRILSCKINPELITEKISWSEYYLNLELPNSKNIDPFINPIDADVLTKEQIVFILKEHWKDILLNIDMHYLLGIDIDRESLMQLSELEFVINKDGYDNYINYRVVDPILGPLLYNSCISVTSFLTSTKSDHHQTRITRSLCCTLGGLIKEYVNLLEKN